MLSSVLINLNIKEHFPKVLYYWYYTEVYTLMGNIHRQYGSKQSDFIFDGMFIKTEILQRIF